MVKKKSWQLDYQPNKDVFSFCNDINGEHISRYICTVEQQTVITGEEAFTLQHELKKIGAERHKTHIKIIDPIFIRRKSSQ